MYSNLRLQLLAGGERAGKSFESGLYLASRVPFGELYWIVADNYELARPEFDYTVDFLFKAGAFESERKISKPKVGKATAVTKTGQLIETKTADDVRKLAAVAPDGIIMAEAAQQPYEAYLRCVGRVAQKRGWVLLSGTFEGSLGWYAELFNEWQDPHNPAGGRSYSMPSWSNTVIYPGGRTDPEIKKLEALYARVPGLFDERCGAIPVPPAFLVFREFRHTIHVRPDVKYNPALPVYLAIDPASGTNPYAVLACQFAPDPEQEGRFGEEGEDDVEKHPDPIDFCRVIDEDYSVGEGAEEIIARLKHKPWWPRVAGGAIDVEDPDERRRWQTFGKVALRASKIDQLAGIRRLKSFLHYELDDTGESETGFKFQARPHLQVARHVESLPYEFGVFKRKPAVTDDRIPREKPPSDQPNHSLKALWYLLYHRYGDVKRAVMLKPVTKWQRPKRASTDRFSSPTVLESLQETQTVFGRATRYRR